MDLKIKGITWVGNIYQKLESICLEVDNLVRQDPVKYVENQVHTGSESMKKICSGIVQELLPSSVHPVQPEAESVPLIQNDENRRCIKSLTGVGENLIDVDVKELPVDLDAIDPVENAWADGLSFSEVPLVVELMPELSKNSIVEENFSLSLGDTGDVPGNKNPDVRVTENFKKEKPSSHQFWGLNSVPKKGLCEPSLPSVSLDEDHENVQVILSEVSPVCSVHDEGLKSHEKLGSNCADETEFVSHYLNTPLSSELACSVEASACSVYGERLQRLQKMETTSGNSANETMCISDCLGVAWSSGLASPVEFCDIETPTSAHSEKCQSLQNVGKIFSNSADKNESISDRLSTIFSSELTFFDESRVNKAPVCSIQEGFQSLGKLGTSCCNSVDESDCASDPSNPIVLVEQVLSTDPSNPLPSSEQILLVETCEIKEHGEGLESLKKMGTSCSNSSDDIDCVSDPSNLLLSAKQIISVETCEIKALACAVHGDGFQSHENLGTTCSDFADETIFCSSDPLNPLPFTEKVLSVETNENKVPACLVHDEVFQSSKKLGTTCSDSENGTDCVSDRLSALLPSEHSCEDKVANMRLVCSSNSLATEGYDLSKLLPANFPIKERKICNLDGDAFCVPDMSSSLPSFNLVPIVPCLNVSSEIGCTSPCGMELNGLDTSEVNDTVTQSGSSGNKCDQSWESAQLEAFISFELGQSDDAGDDISGMDTIELSDKVEPEDCSFFVDNKELYAVSCRLQKLRSYRKRIQDAFTSKKRRAKEYEQLAIWYGDTNGESSQNTQNLLAASTSKQVDLKKLPTHDSCDSEWELL